MDSLSWSDFLKNSGPDIWVLTKFFVKLLWPVWAALLVLLVAKIAERKLKKIIDQKRLERVKKKCPDCAEWVPKEALKCSHCGKDF